eukprot:365654-Chlamydomonas_euryale.AAC.10
MARHGGVAGAEGEGAKGAGHLPWGSSVLRALSARRTTASRYQRVVASRTAPPAAPLPQSVPPAAPSRLAVPCGWRYRRQVGRPTSPPTLNSSLNLCSLASPEATLPGGDPTPEMLEIHRG